MEAVAHASVTCARAARAAFAMAVLLASGVSPADAAAAPAMPVRTVDAPRITVADVVPGAPTPVAGVDLGPAPPAGADRIVSREEILSALPAGETLVAARVPRVTRVVRATTKLSIAALDGLVRGALATKLPRGATLSAVRPKRDALVPRTWDSVDVVLPRLSRKPGRHAVVATVRIAGEGATLATLAVPIELLLSPEGAAPDVRRGAPVAIHVAHGAVEVQASGRANEDADVGDLLQVTVDGSGKVLRARLASAQPPRATVEP